MSSSMLSVLVRSARSALHVPGPAGHGASHAAAALGVGAQRTPLSLPTGMGRDMSSSAKEEDASRMGTTTQEGAEDKRAAAEEAGFQRAREDGERVREDETLMGKASAAGSVVSDVARGVGEFGKKVADMAREAAGRGAETVRGMAGTEDVQGAGQKVADMGKEAAGRGAETVRGVTGSDVEGAGQKVADMGKEAVNRGKESVKGMSGMDQGKESQGNGGMSGGTAEREGNLSGTSSPSSRGLDASVTPNTLTYKTDTRVGSYSSSTIPNSPS